ncbi:hypothetical protein R1sor_019838 [Riccia sorocarpa]|uniref:Uncharacterized protein n=1 Tax=Riccia sorocarpa TaxID=122646 RepID=A0ABD3IHV3_9MARC
MAPFNLVRVNYSDYVCPPTIYTEMIPNLVILPEEWEVWDAMGIRVTPPVVRNLDETVCYARQETGLRHTQSERTLLQDPVVTTTKPPLTTLEDTKQLHHPDMENALRCLSDYLIELITGWVPFYRILL